MLSWRWAFWVLQWSITLPKRQNVRSSLWQRCSLPNSHRSLQLNSKLSLPPIQSHLHYPGGRLTLLFWPTNVEVKVMVHRRSRLRSTGAFDCFVVHLLAGEGRQLNIPRVVDPRPALPPNWSKRLYQHPTNETLCFLMFPLVFSGFLRFVHLPPSPAPPLPTLALLMFMDPSPVGFALHLKNSLEKKQKYLENINGQCQRRRDLCTTQCSSSPICPT